MQTETRGEASFRDEVNKTTLELIERLETSDEDIEAFLMRQVATLTVIVKQQNKHINQLTNLLDKVLE